MEGFVPDSIPNFTPRDANPKLLHVARDIVPAVEIAGLKVKPEALPPGTPACERVGKKQKLKPATEYRDYTKVGIFCLKEGATVLDLFPNDLKKNYCTGLTFLSMIRNALTTVRIASLVILRSGTGFLQTTRSKFWSTAMQLEEKWFG